MKDISSEELGEALVLFFFNILWSVALYWGAWTFAAWPGVAMAYGITGCLSYQRRMHGKNR